MSNNWFRRNLENRTQYVLINSFKSNIAQITCGVPQGSILGPLLFLMYINDLPKSTSLKLLSFADDTTVFISGPNLNELNNTMNSELNKLFVWLNENKLSLNVDKTKYMVFSANSRLSFPTNVKINGKSIGKVGKNCNDSGIKFLGVIMDEQLTWKNHISHLTAKIAHAIFVLNSVKNYLPHSALLTLYYALVDCHFKYNIIAWGNSPFVTKLVKLQKRAIRILFRKPYRFHTEPLFKISNILKLKDKYEITVALFALQYKISTLPSSFSNFYPRMATQHATRQINNICVSCFRIKFSSTAAYHMIPKIWNNLDHNLKSVTNKKSLHKILKTTRLNLYIDN